MKFKVLIWILWTVILFFVSVASPIMAASRMEEQTYKKLDFVRDEKRKQLYSYLSRVQSSVERVRHDELMKTFFLLKRKYVLLKKMAATPAEFAKRMEDIKANIKSHYLLNYLIFYDILFIDKNGYLFYSIRKGAERKINIFLGELSKTALSRRIREDPSTSFVDYQYFPISKEPSAFFVIPVEENGNNVGWLVLQCTINKINRIFNRDQGIGATGEVFLVNQNCRMLTDSRFLVESSILKQHLSKENITSKYVCKSGHKKVTDYRGKTVLTSFEVCTIAKEKWLLIAKIDENEILTNQFKSFKLTTKSKILKALDIAKSKGCSKSDFVGERIEVDMDETRRAVPGQVLCTYGVSTCTAIVIAIPGKFSYMAHISNLDQIYGNNITDLIGRTMDRLEMFDIYPYQKQKLQITLIAIHDEAIVPAIDLLLSRGIFLSQIRLMKNDAKYANPTHDTISGLTCVDWIQDRKTASYYSQCSSGFPTLNRAFKSAITRSEKLQ